jgi:hypothetical protein
MLRMEPNIKGSRTDGDDTQFVPPVALPELDVRATNGEGERERGQWCGRVGLRIDKFTKFPLTRSGRGHC